MSVQYAVCMMYTWTPANHQHHHCQDVDVTLTVPLWYTTHIILPKKTSFEHELWNAMESGGNSDSPSSRRIDAWLCVEHANLY